MTSALLITMSLLLFPLEKRDDLSERLDHAAEVLVELVNEPDAEVPVGLIDEAECVAVISEVRKPMFGFGYPSLRGPVSCRGDAGWSAPSMLAVDAPSFGFQLGLIGDMVLLFMAEDSVQHLTGNEVALGRDASIANGPKDRDPGANTSFTLDTEILTYNKEDKGFYERIAWPSREPPRLRPDRDANRQLYGREISAEEILLHGISVPALATGFMAAIRSN